VVHQKEPGLPDAVDRLCREYLDLTYQASPMTATAYGEHAFDELLDELTEENLDRYIAELGRLADRLRRVEVGGPEDKADRDALLAEITGRVLEHELERPWRRNPFLAAASIPASLLDLIAREFAPLERRMRSAASRLEAAPRFLDRAKRLLDEPCPRLWRQMAAATAISAAGFLREQLPRAAAGTELAGRVAEAAGTAADAMGDFARWLTDEHAVRFPEDAPFAIGEVALARKLQEAHCLATTPAELLAIGESQVSQTTAALAEQAGHLGDGDWSGLLDRVKADHPSLDRLLPAYAAELDRLEQFVFEHDLASDPQAKAEVEPTPEFLRGFMGYAAYYPAGPFDAYQQGYFWVTPPPDEAGLRDHSWAMIPAVAAHEGYPGHHLQMTSVNRLHSVTRRTLRSTLMIEGWGLYTEQLMHDVGYYDDNARLAQLSMRLLRALRIVLDMELQAGVLTYQAAVERAVSVGRLEESTARSEVARYTMTPTQPCSYLVGALELEHLRATTQARLGDAFRLRRFHDRVLSYGHMPPTLVARAITAADEREQRRPPDDG
jgi:uncharacterized protein (DUF885 family)